MKATRQNSTTTRIFSGILAVWMSGVVFLLCCGSTVSESRDRPDSCPLAKTNHCDKSAESKAQPSKDQKASELAAIQPNDAAVNCCGFLPAIFDKIKKAEKDQLIAVLPVKMVIDAPASVFNKVERISSIYYRPPVLSRSGTYLKNRVLRI